MNEVTNPRAADYAKQYEAAQEELISLLSPLTDEQWRMVGKNYPRRLNDEDEGRTVGVIADHVAASEDFIMERILLMLEDKPLAPVDIRQVNTARATRHADVTREEVISRLRQNKERIAARVADIPDDRLDMVRDTPAGPMSVAQRLERVLIGHINNHMGSIRAALS